MARYRREISTTSGRKESLRKGEVSLTKSRNFPPTTVHSADTSQFHGTGTLTRHKKPADWGTGGLPWWTVLRVDLDIDWSCGRLAWPSFDNF